MTDLDPSARRFVVMFSGGRTSGYLLREMIRRMGRDEFCARFLVIFCNTGKERQETLDFVHDCEVRWDIPIIWLEYHRVPAADIPPGVFPSDRMNQNLAKAVEAGVTAHWFRVVNFLTASRKGEPFNELLEWMGPLPNPVGRSCSTQMKFRTAARFMFSIGTREYCPLIGIRADEAHRKVDILASCENYEHPEFPLIDWGTDKMAVRTFWARNDFDLRLLSYEGNCDLCFLKAKWKRVRVAREQVGSVTWWKDWEARKAKTTDNPDGAIFRLGEPYERIERLAQQAEFDIPPGDEPDIPCSCAERGFGRDDSI